MQKSPLLIAQQPLPSPVLEENLDPLVVEEALPSLPEEKSPTLMIKDVLGDPTLKVETAETHRVGGRRDQVQLQEKITMKGATSIMKSKLKYHQKNKLSIRQ